jgi:pyrroloquinoline quinone biosynthesis protein A
MAARTLRHRAGTVRHRCCSSGTAFAGAGPGPATPPCRRARPAPSHPAEVGIGQKPAATEACHEETLMTWTTPTAADFRFGFEITMYVANR